MLKGLSNAPSNNGEYDEEESAWQFHNPAFSQKEDSDIICEVIEVKNPKTKSGRLSASVLPSTICEVIQEDKSTTKIVRYLASIATAATLELEGSGKDAPMDEGISLQPSITLAMHRETNVTTVASLKHEDAEKESPWRKNHTHHNHQQLQRFRLDQL